MTKIVFEDMVKTLAKPGEEILATLTPEKVNMWHMATGFMGEVAELLASTTKDNDVEETGDFEFYLEGYCQAHEMYVMPYSSVDEEETTLAERKLKLAILSGDLFDLTKKYVVYNKPIDDFTLVELVESIKAQLQLIYQSINIKRDEVIDYNINKLGKRYEGLKYSDRAAQERADKAESIANGENM